MKREGVRTRDKEMKIEREREDKHAQAELMNIKGVVIDNKARVFKEIIIGALSVKHKDLFTGFKGKRSLEDEGIDLRLKETRDLGGFGRMVDQIPEGNESDQRSWCRL